MRLRKIWYCQKYMFLFFSLLIKEKTFSKSVIKIKFFNLLNLFQF